MKYFVKQLIVFFLLMFSFSPWSVLAADPIPTNVAEKNFGFDGAFLKKIAGGSSYVTTGTSGNAFNDQVKLILEILFSFLGVIFIGIIMYAGYLWMMGDKFGDLAKAKKMLMDGVTGIVIIGAAYAISMFVISQLSKGMLKNL